ncbi:MAG TPA: Uma2 family endonuclease [Solirubrobacteraceae bacterium]|nr:Uma2 family endonuclease [Solirubrobacteraceae bacterium]
MGLVVGDREVRPLTADEVMRMVEAGVLGEDEPVELLHGVLTAVSPKSAEHGSVVARLVRWLVESDPERLLDIRIGHPLLVPDSTSLPEPDVLVTAASAPGNRHPTTALLVVEVAVSSLRIDTTIKAPLYAAADVPEYWIVDVAGRRLDVFTDPTPDGYAEHAALAPPQSVRPRDIDADPLALAELFAGV